MRTRCYCEPGIKKLLGIPNIPGVSPARPLTKGTESDKFPEPDGVPAVTANLFVHGNELRYFHEVFLITGHVHFRYNAYELFGFDVLFDSNLKPWLLEVNVSPSLHSTSLLDEAVKEPLINDTLNIVGFHIPVSKRFSDQELAQELGEAGSNPVSYDNRMYTPVITTNEKYKHYNFINKFNRSDYLDRILNDLTPDDVRHLIVYEDELTQLGSFEKIFPTHETYKYLKYFEKNRYHNLLLDAWESKYYNNRQKGIQLLQNLCQQKIHLRIARKNENTKKGFQLAGAV